MFRAPLGILDFPRQECQLNRKRGELRELSMHSKQLTMNNNETKSDSAQAEVLGIIHQFCIEYELVACLFLPLVNASTCAVSTTPSLHVQSVCGVCYHIAVALMIYAVPLVATMITKLLFLLAVQIKQKEDGNSGLVKSLTSWWISRKSEVQLTYTKMSKGIIYDTAGRRTNPRPGEHSNCPKLKANPPKIQILDLYIVYFCWYLQSSVALWCHDLFIAWSARGCRFISVI